MVAGLVPLLCCEALSGNRGEAGLPGRRSPCLQAGESEGSLKIVGLPRASSLVEGRCVEPVGAERVKDPLGD